MNNSCEKIVEQILATNSTFSEVIKSHIKSCDSCKELAANWIIIKNQSNNDDTIVPTNLDFQIMSIAKQSIVSKRRIRFFIKALSYSTSAACAVFAFGICFLPITDKSISTKIIQVQNSVSDYNNNEIASVSFEEVATNAIYDILNDDNISIPKNNSVWNDDMLTQQLNKLSNDLEVLENEFTFSINK